MVSELQTNAGSSLTMAFNHLPSDVPQSSNLPFLKRVKVVKLFEKVKCLLHIPILDAVLVRFHVDFM